MIILRSKEKSFNDYPEDKDDFLTVDDWKRFKEYLLNPPPKEPFVHPWKDKINDFMDRKYPDSKELRERMLRGDYGLIFDKDRNIEFVFSKYGCFEATKNFPLPKMPEEGTEEYKDLVFNFHRSHNGF